MQQNYEYYYQSQFQSPNHPSAPPVPSSYSSSDYSNYQNHDHVPSPYSYHDQVQTPPNYDPFLNFGYESTNSGYERTNKLVFDDYGRPINLQVGQGPVPGGSGKASPEMETQEDGKSGVQKFRVMMLAEGGNQSDINITCQIGLEGVRMLDPASGRILKTYPLDTVTRWEVLDSSIFVFWAKNSIDIQPRRIRLKSNSYTTNAILDTLTAATVQLKEMGGKHLSSDSSKVSDQSTEKKKSIADWMKLVKPINEEKIHWVPDEAASKCMTCSTDFSAFVRKHHCRNCGSIFCDKCTQGRIALITDEEAQPVRVCDQCMAEVTQRLSNARESSENIVGTQNDGDLAKKLQEEIERSRRPSSGLNSDISDKQMREVACPTCTVHLQVLVPTTGSQTIECSVCQHPFLVDAH